MSDLPEKAPKRLSETDDAMSRLLAQARDGSAHERVGSRERIWKRVVGAPTPTRWWVPSVAGAFAAAILFFFFRPMLSPAPDLFATLALTSGEVQATQPDASWSAAQVGDLLAEGAGLRTADHSRAYARFASTGALFSDTTRASLSRSGTGVAVQLDEGAVAFSVRHGAGGLVVHADAYTIEVTGTVFQVKVGAEKVVEVFVHEGSVRVRGGTTDVSLHAGESWSSRSGSGRGAMAQEDVDAVRGLSFVAAKEATLRIAGPKGASIAVDGIAVGLAPVSLLEELGSHEVVASIGGSRSVARTTVVSAGTTFEPVVAPPQPLPSLAPPEEKPVVLQPGEADAAPRLQKKLEGKLPEAERDTATYELARLLSRRGRNAEATALYEKLAAGSGAWVEVSLYEVGRLKLRYLADRDGSIAAFADYRRRYPNGALAQEVALSAIEAQLAKGSTEVALRELDAFVAAFPSSERLDDVRLIRATLRRDRGDCAQARGDYLLLLESPHADDALYFAAYCEQQDGQADEARQHLNTYLVKFPGGRHRDEVKAALGR